MKSNPEKSKFDLAVLPAGLRKEIESIEAEAQTEVTKFAARLQKMAKHGTKTLEESLNESGIKLQEREKTKEIFKQTILQRAEGIASNLLKYSLGREESVPFNVMLLETVIDILTSVQDFKAKVDQLLPIKCDKIIQYATPALLVVATTYAPALGTILKNTGALEKVASFLKDDNLASTIDTFRDTLGKFNKDKGLSTINKTSELSGYIGIAVTTISKLGLGSKALDIVIDGVSASASLKSFMQEVSSYTEKVFPQSVKGIDTTLQSIKKSTVSAIEKAGASEEVVKKAEKQIDKHLVQVKATLKENLNLNVSVFDKIRIQQNAANLMLGCIKDITQTVKINISEPKIANLIIGVVTDTLKKGIKDRLQGNLDKIAKQVQDPKVKEFAKKTLGAGHANLMDVAKGAMKLSVTGASRSR
jgi:hypothetical protein